MRITTAKTYPGAYVGDPDVTLTITYQGAAPGQAMPGATVAYHVTDGRHTVCGADISAPIGFRASESDLFRAVAEFLSYEPEHSDAHDRGLWDTPCPEYGAMCPTARPEWLEALEQLAPALSDAAHLAEAA